MSRPTKSQPTSRRRWHLAVVAGCVVLLSTALLWIRAGTLPEDPGQQAAAPAGADAAPARVSSDYAQRIVAIIDEHLSITRQELGEYLIARCGAERLENLVNRRIIEEACKASHIDVATAEVEAALNDDLASLGVDRKRFVNQILRGYKKNLVEWKEDVIRSRLMLAKLCRDRVTCTEDEVQAAYEAAYGEKVEGRIIVWEAGKDPKAQKDMVDQKWLSIHDSEEAFANEARLQSTPELAKEGGKVTPFARHATGNEKLEYRAFLLHPGQVTAPIDMPDGQWLVFKCDARLPADTTVNLEAVRDKLVKDVVEKKLREEVKTTFQKLKEQAKPQLQLNPANPANGVVAYIKGYIPITREELGEYLINRYGPERLENLVNQRIIEEECKARHIEVTAAEVEAALNKDLTVVSGTGTPVSRAEFEKRVLAPQKKSLYEWMEDAIKPRLLLSKLCCAYWPNEAKRPQLLQTRLNRDHVSWEEKDVQAAFEAYYGEKVDGRLIMWPLTEERIALQEYASIRDSDDVFNHKARQQASPRLAPKGGKLDKPITHHSTGNDELEREVFSLQPGDVSRVLQTPEGFVVFKCDQRLPADPTVKLEAVRGTLIKEVAEKKLQQEIPRMFAAMKEKAHPRLLLKNPDHPVDLASEVERELPPDLKPRHTEMMSPQVAGGDRR